MHIALCTISYREKLLEVALEAAQTAGFEAVEIWGREPHVSEQYDESRVRGVRKMVEAHGLKLPVFGSYLALGRTQNREDSVSLIDTLHIAHGLHAQVIRVWASDVGSARASDEVWAKTVSEAQEACDRAAKMSVVFAAEMHDATLADTGATARRLVEEVDRPNFRLNFQVGNFEAEDQMARLEAVLPYVVHVHCQNFVPAENGNVGKYQRVPIEAGMIDYQPLVQRLREAGYEGHLAVEFAAEEGAGKEQSLRRDRKFLASL